LGKNLVFRAIGEELKARRIENRRRKELEA